jgi:pyruvate dehydrogenase complex dehydrogenase (E1) component
VRPEQGIRRKGCGLNENLDGGSGQDAPVVDADSVETKEWVDSLQAVVREGGPQRGLYLVKELEEQLRRRGIRSSVQQYSAVAAIAELVREGLLDAKIQQAAITRYGVNVERAAPWTI